MSYQKAADLIKYHNYIVAFTGAGISTTSGIPDYRSPETGLWNLIDPDEIPTLSRFKADPEEFYKSFKPLLINILNAIPNPAHYSLTKLESQGILKSIITQNIDMLHQKSGAELVIELHGTLNTGTCISCYQQVELISLMEFFIQDGIIPACKTCGAYLKPDIILFEEQLPHKAWQNAREEIESSDLLLVIGSSLETFPAAHLPSLAVSNGAKVILINKSELITDLDVDEFIKDDASTALPKILELD